MKIAAVIAEYNPFHLGHEYMLTTVRNMGYDRIIAVMSGNFVQRGDAAISDKRSRFFSISKSKDDCPFLPSAGFAAFSGII